MKPCTME